MSATSSDRGAEGASPRRPLVPRLLLAVLLLAMAGCASQRAQVETPPPAAAAAPARTGGYVGGTVVMECAPFARAVSGVDLKGPAADWWWAASGRYTRTSTPVVGSVLAFRRSTRLPDGHAAVVSRLVSEREIRVTQANWVHSRVTDDMPVIDVSDRNDWTLVRVWWPPSGQMGTRRYPTWGFITPERPAVRDALEAAMMRIVLAAPNP